jgi:hypothetical protein
VGHKPAWSARHRQQAQVGGHLEMTREMHSEMVGIFHSDQGGGPPPPDKRTNYLMECSFDAVDLMSGIPQ